MYNPKLSKKVFFKTLFFLIFSNIGMHAQQLKGVIKGKVSTTYNEPAPNVNVTLKGTKYETATNEDGRFEFKVARGTYYLIVSHFGVKNQQVTVEVKPGQTVKLPEFIINIATSTLNEVNVNDKKNNKFHSKQSLDVAKMPLNDLENPQVYTTVTKELMQEQAVFSADDAIKNVPGITTLWNATGRVLDGGAYLTLRGFATQIQLRNGLAGHIANIADAANLEKLEIIKGPEGTLYGSDLTSYGGLINRVTKKPFETTAGEVNYSIGSYGLNRISADINTPLDASGKALLRINTAYNSTSTFQDNGFSRNFVFDPSFIYKVNKRLTLSFDAEINHGKGTTPVMIYMGPTVAQLGVNRADQLSFDYKRAYQSNDLSATSNNVNFFFKADYKLSANWKSQTTVSSTYSNSNGPNPTFFLAAGNNSVERDVYNVNGHSSTLQLQQNLTGNFKIIGLKNKLVTGLDILNQKVDTKFTYPTSGTQVFDVVNTKGSIPNFNQAAVDSLFNNTDNVLNFERYNTYTYSAYAVDVLNITDNLFAMAGLRIDHFYSKSVFDPVDNTTTNAFNQTTLSPKFGLVYQLVKDKVSLFGNYMNGFNNPGYYMVHDAATNINVTRLFKSEQANQWEGGIKLDIFDGRLSSTISYYDISVKNKIRPDVNYASASIQDGTQNSKGIDAEVIANPVSGFNIIAGYSHNTSLMTKSSSYDNGRRPQTAGPANTANLWLSYTLTQGEAKGLGIGFGGNYAGDNQVINNSYNGVFTLPAYTILNTGIFYNRNKYRVALNVNNLADKHYWVGYTTINPQMLRQVILSLTYRFF